MVTARSTIFFAGLMVAAAGCQDRGSAPAAKSGAASQAGKSQAGGQVLGQPLHLAQVTDLDEIVNNPKKFEGKTLRVRGVVTAHCHHQLAWFALRKSAKARATLRVMTRPAFLVPKTVKHGVTQAEAEGVVQLRTVPEDQAKHLAREHGLFGGEPDRIRGPQYIVSLRATGAVFL